MFTGEGGVRVRVGSAGRHHRVCGLTSKKQEVYFAKLLIQSFFGSEGV
jgi:hypothetical protein